ncbi:unnamed protein product [Arctia plantaginis]|uniref:Uncharacterized protein n=1 Tax=Arctia plantaginis TaxID=874455 RepID=A0A8S1B311_ARCPL|nr:unnamed protein product [Arctia plantaginis]
MSQHPLRCLYNTDVDTLLLLRPRHAAGAALPAGLSWTAFSVCPGAHQLKQIAEVFQDVTSAGVFGLAF